MASRIAIGRPTVPLASVRQRLSFCSGDEGSNIYIGWPEYISTDEVNIVANINRVSLNGTPIDVIGANAAAAMVLARLDGGVRTRVAAVNAAIAVMASDDNALRNALNSCDLVIADGKWAAVAASCLSGRWVPHTNTSPFLRALFFRCTKRGLRVFLLGARPEVVRQAAEQLPQLFPGVDVVGFEHGYFRLDEEEALISRINDTKAEILLVGMTTPKKELLIRQYWSTLNVPIAFGIGGLIDIWGGKTKEAPEWVRNSGFEWLFRLAQEPYRLGRRYTIDNLSFFWLIIRQAFGKTVANN